MSNNNYNSFRNPSNNKLTKSTNNKNGFNSNINNNNYNNNFQNRPSTATYNRPNSSIGFNNSTRYFNPNKTSTHNFFKDTRVDSCSHIVEAKGRTIAVPFSIINSKGRPLSAFKYTSNKTIPSKTIYKKDYTVKKIEHVGMYNKPLSVYHPNAYRNRLPVTGFFMNHKNQSLVNIGESHSVNNKQWLSTAKDAFRWPKPTPVTNSGILSDRAKLSHKKLVSYQ